MNLTYLNDSTENSGYFLPAGLGFGGKRQLHKCNEHSGGYSGLRSLFLVVRAPTEAKR
jgi:hypothetical protein